MSCFAFLVVLSLCVILIFAISMLFFAVWLGVLVSAIVILVLNCTYLRRAKEEAKRDKYIGTIIVCSIVIVVMMISMFV